MCEGRGQASALIEFASRSPSEPQTREYSRLEMATFLRAFSVYGSFGPAC